MDMTLSTSTATATAVAVAVSKKRLDKIESYRPAITLRYHSLRDEKVTRNIRANHQFEVRLCIVGERLRDVDASAVGQEINVIKVFDSGIGHFYGRVHFADVPVHKNEVG